MNTATKAIAALVAGAAFAAAAQSNDGVEIDGPARGGRRGAGNAPRQRHLRVTAWDLKDRTDGVGELVQKREWLLLPGTAPFDVECAVADVQDVLTGEGTAYLRIAALPGSRNWSGADFRVKPGSPQGIEVLKRPAECVAVPYTGGDVGRRAALTAAHRRLRPYVAGRDGLFLSNTWGDRNRDSRICEPFMEKEIAAAAALGVDVVQIDDGWQRGRTSNSAAANGNGVWGGYWAKDPQFWEPDPVRFPHGLAALSAKAAALGVRLGLWFGPDSSDDAANWERDAGLLLKYHREAGINYFKIDSMKTKSALSLERQSALFGKVLGESGGRVVFDLDVTAETRPGYMGLPAIGPVFVENRYTDWHKYWPHQTLRQFWSLCEVLDPVRLRMEILNLKRNAKLYDGDPLAPAEWPVESAFAGVMLGSPLGWFEASGLDAETVAALAPFVAKWKEHRERLHAGVVHPVGARPDGVSWTGFVVVCADGGGYALFFRELNASDTFSFDLSPYLAAKSAKTLSPRGSAALDGTALKVTVARPLDFVWAELE